MMSGGSTKKTISNWFTAEFDSTFLFNTKLGFLVS